METAQSIAEDAASVNRRQLETTRRRKRVDGNPKYPYPRGIYAARAGVGSPESGGPADIGEPCGQLPQPRFLGGKGRPCLVPRCDRARCPHRRGARLGIARTTLCAGVTGRRALRGYRGGRTETPPAKLSACATCHYSRALPKRITHSHGAMRRDGDIAPYRHYARAIRTRITRAARWSPAVAHRRVARIVRVR